MDIDLLVIGGGFWGCAIANLAVERGLNTHLIDNGYLSSGSRNASGLSNPAWFKDGKGLPIWWTKRDTSGGLNYLYQMGGKPTGELFSSYQNPAVRYRDGLITCPTLKPFLETDAKRHQRSVLRLERSIIDSGWFVEMMEGDRLWAQNVVLATGRHTDLLLKLSGLPTTGVTGLRGRSLILRGSVEWTAPRTHLSRPYTCYTLKAWDDGCLHLGATTERSSMSGEKQFSELLRMKDLLAPQTKVVDVLDGYRPVCPNGPVVEKWTDHLIVATGAGKVGLTMALPVANRVLGML